MKLDQIISKLGGPSGASAVLGSDGEPSPAAVSMWLQRGIVPYRWRLPLFTTSQQKGLPVAPEDVGLPPASNPTGGGPGGSGIDGKEAA